MWPLKPVALRRESSNATHRKETNAAGQPPTAPHQLQWLVDRAAISDLLIDFARALDDRDWEGYAANYAEDGVLAISPTISHAGRAGLANFVAASLGKYAGTHHVSSNHAITLDGDTAATRSYLIAAQSSSPAIRLGTPTALAGTAASYAAPARAGGSAASPWKSATSRASHYCTERRSLDPKIIPDTMLMAAGGSSPCRSDLSRPNADVRSALLAWWPQLGTIGREEAGCMLHRLACRSSQSDQWRSPAGTARARQGGSPRPETGARSARRGTAGAARLCSCS